MALLDVNIPMFAAGQPHPYKESCTWVMTQIAAGGLAVSIDTEIIQEILYRYGALRRWEIATSMAGSLLELVSNVHPIRVSEVRLALGLYQQYAPQGVTARDVIHVAVMQNNGLSQIISTDGHFDHLPGIVRLDPRSMFAQVSR